MSDKIQKDIVFVLVPAMSVIITLSWREFIVEYANTHLDCDPIVRKFLTAMFATFFGLVVLYFMRE